MVIFASDLYGIYNGSPLILYLLLSIHSSQLSLHTYIYAITYILCFLTIGQVTHILEGRSKLPTMILRRCYVQKITEIPNKKECERRRTEEHVRYNHRISRYRMRAWSRHKWPFLQTCCPFKSAILDLSILFKANYPLIFSQIIQ